MKASSERFYDTLARLIAKSPGLVLGMALLVALGATALAVTGLEFKTSRGALIGEEHEFRRLNQELEKEHGDLDTIVVVIEGEDRAACRQCADDLAARLAKRPKLIRSVFYRVRSSDFGPEALLFVEPDQIERLEPVLADSLPNLSEGALPTVFEAAATMMEQRLENPGSERSGDFKAFTQLLGDLEALAAGEARAAPDFGVQDFFGGRDPDRGYSWGSDEAMLIMLVAPARDSADFDPRAKAVKALRAEAQALQKQYPVRVGLTGGPVLDVDEIKTYMRDSSLAAVLSLIGVTILLVFALRRLVAPVLIGVCLLLSIALTLGATSVYPGHLNLLSTVFVVVIIGLGVDFGLHLISRFDEERGRHKELSDALSEAMKKTGSATVAGALTTSFAFYTALFTDFKGLQELGVIAGSGVLCALFVMLTVLPALILVTDRFRSDPGPSAKPSEASKGGFWRALESTTQGKPGLVLGISLLLSIGAGLLVPGLQFKDNLLELQDPSLPSVKLEYRLLENQRLTGWFLCLSASSLEDLRERQERLSKLERVRKTESVLDIIPTEQARKRSLWKRVGALLKTRPRTGAMTLEDLDGALERFLGALEDAQEAAFKGRQLKAVKGLDGLIERVEEVIPKLGKLADAGPVERYDQALLTSFQESLAGLEKRIAGLGELGVNELPVSLRERFVGQSGRFLLRIYPDCDVWDREAVEAFIAEVRALEPKVTGAPIVVQESSRLMVRSYQESAVYSLVIISVFLVFYFRSLRATLLALFSLLLGALWFVGLMSLFGVPFNPGNLIALPLLLGIGIDYSVHVVHRARESGSMGPLQSTSLGNAILFSALTSVLGFGSLMVSNHRGTGSIGSSISLGILCIVVSSLTFLPALLAFGDAGEVSAIDGGAD